MKSAPFILALIAAGLAVIHIIWPNNAIIGTSALLIAVAVAISGRV